MSTLNIETASEAETEALGARVAAVLPEVRLIYVRGPLGAGKTAFVRGLLRGLDYAGPVKSPTFTLVEPYPFTGFVLCHFDLYRIEHPQELEFLGLRDYLSGDNVCVVEWPERAGALLPDPDLNVIIQPNGKQGRKVELQAYSPPGEAGLNGLR
jgi:tRNA threonylcarbamoyladenosine biosynthesis protein TsaE